MFLLLNFCISILVILVVCILLIEVLILLFVVFAVLWCAILFMSYPMVVLCDDVLSIEGYKAS